MWPFELLSGRLSAHGTHKTRAEIKGPRRFLYHRLLRHYAKWALTHGKYTELGRRKYEQGALRHYANQTISSCPLKSLRACLAQCLKSQ